MRCPKCHSLENKVIDSRMSRDGASIRRRRECLECAHRFTTYEYLEEADFLVVKRNGAREQFSREKLLRGIIRACEKRPVPRDTMEQSVDEIIADIQKQSPKEVPTKWIGLKVMEKLQHIDPVAYVRFASVYRQFQDVGEFIEEIQHLEKRTPRSGLQPELFGQ